MSLIQQAADYLFYRLRAKNLHGVHSPFFYALNEQVVNEGIAHPACGVLEQFRKELRNNRQVVNTQTFGAASKAGSQIGKTVAELEKKVAVSPAMGRMLYRLTAYFQPENILELGTSLGISTGYFASAAAGVPVITHEGNPDLVALARENFRKLNLQNISIVEGDFDQTLPQTLETIEKVGLAYIDGNHRLEPTLKYFELIKSKCSTDSILIFDDIYWSGEMKKAWRRIQADRMVRQTVDLFYFGLVFFREDMARQHHYLLHP